MDSKSLRDVKPFYNFAAAKRQEAHEISPRQPMWVPFPGSKRKAEDSDILYDEFGPAQPKLRALDENVAPDLLKDGFIVTDEDLRDSGKNSLLLCPNDDEEMKDSVQQDQSLPFTSPECAGVHHYLNTKSSTEVDVHDSYDEKTNLMEASDVNVKNLTISPKIYFFEGLREVLSNKQSDDLPIPRTLVDHYNKSSSMAMVLWKPSSLPTLSSSSSVNCSSSSQTQHKKQQASEAEEDDKMDLSS